METANGTPVAVLGAGRMGAAIIEVLASRGHAVRVWNRSPTKARLLEGDRVVAVDSTADAVAGCRVVISMLADDAAVSETLAGLDLPPAAVLVEASTVGPHTVAQIDERAPGRLVGAAVSGTPAVVRAGRAGILFSGPEPAKAIAAPLLRDIAAQVVDLGPEPAAAKLAKLGLNAVLAGTSELLAETVVLMESGGLPREAFAQALESSVLASPFVEYKMEAALRRDYEATFSTQGLAKDLHLVLAQAARRGLDLPLLGHTRELVDDAVSRDLGEKDFLSLLPRLQAANDLPSDIPVPTKQR